MPPTFDTSRSAEATPSRAVVHSVVVALSVLCWTTQGRAQTESAPGGSLPTAPVAVSVGYEVHRDRIRYRFENPSNFSTPFLVPHEFTQGYVADNQWLVVSTRVRNSPRGTVNLV